MLTIIINLKNNASIKENIYDLRSMIYELKTPTFTFAGRIMLSPIL
jgi:hypothetical protein